MFSPRIKPDEGLILVQTTESRLDAAIHMFFVSFDLGVVWLDSQQRVVDTVCARKWAMFYQPSFPARSILEIHPSRLTEFCKGDVIALDYE